MKAICLLSGGMDSLVTLGIALKEQLDIYPIFFDYGQKSKKQEEKAYDKICDYYNLKNRKKISLAFFDEIVTSALISKDKMVDKNVDINNLTETTENYVPFRNTILLSLATAYAETIGASYIYSGNEPNNMNPDNSVEFISALQRVVNIGTKKGTNIKLITPLINTQRKKDIVRIGMELRVPFELSWSCYDSDAIKNEKSCGKCEKCLFRKQAFLDNNLIDPLEYAE